MVYENVRSVFENKKKKGRSVKVDISIKMNLNTTKIIVIAALLIGSIVSIVLKSEGAFVALMAFITAAIANRDYQDRKKTDANV